MKVSNRQIAPELDPDGFQLVRAAGRNEPNLSICDICESVAPEGREPVDGCDKAQVQLVMSL